MREEFGHLNETPSFFMEVAHVQESCSQKAGASGEVATLEKLWNQQCTKENVIAKIQEARYGEFKSSFFSKDAKWGPERRRLCKRLKVYCSQMRRSPESVEKMTISIGTQFWCIYITF